MIVKDYLLARRLANLYWSGFNQRSGCYLLRWSGLRALSEGMILNCEELEEVVKFLNSFGFLMAQSEEGVIIWSKADVNPRDIPERVLHQALQLIATEDDVEIENEIL